MSAATNTLTANTGSAKSSGKPILVMAAGTGGHVFPALSIVQALAELGVAVEWLGTPNGMENKLLQNTGIPMHQISAKGLKGKGIMRLVISPFMVLRATFQALNIIKEVQPRCVLGMGGYVCGPGGLAAKLNRIPLLLHEQNAVAGLANKVLSVMANRVFEAFPGTFKPAAKVKYTGNPVRRELVRQAGSATGHANQGFGQIDCADRDNLTSLRILVIGGSLGAMALNEMMPGMFQKLARRLPDDCHLEFKHQVGATDFANALQRYQQAGFALDESHEVTEFIDDMAGAYGWADLVVCRSGASTVSELAVMGVPAILIPYPHHKDQQQTHNGNWLVRAGAAKMLQQNDCSSDRLAECILAMQQQPHQLSEMSQAAKSIAISDASEVIAQECLSLCGVMSDD